MVVSPARESAFRLKEIAEREKALMFYGHDRNQVIDLTYSPNSYQ